jgi:hypothetical protein
MGKKLCTLLRDGYWNGTYNVTGNGIGTTNLLVQQKILMVLAKVVRLDSSLEFREVTHVILGKVKNKWKRNR